MYTAIIVQLSAKAVDSLRSSYITFYLFTYGLHDETFNNTNCIRLLINNEMENTGKEVVVANFKATSHHFPGGTDENHEEISQDSSCSSRFKRSVRSRFDMDSDVNFGDVGHCPLTKAHFAPLA
jgi:hypothetical protein